MKKIIRSLCRLILPCFKPKTIRTSTFSATTPPTSSATTFTTATKKKEESPATTTDKEEEQEDGTVKTTRTSTSSATTFTTATKNREESSTTTTDKEEESVKKDIQQQVPSTSRSSESTVIGTIYTSHSGRLRFCIQPDRLSSRHSLLLELSMPTHVLAKEMQFGVLRIAFKHNGIDMINCPLYSVPLWTVYCNRRKAGSAVRRRATDEDYRILKTLQLVSSEVGVIPNYPTGVNENSDGQVAYMRAIYKRVVESSDLESFHLLDSDEDIHIFFIR